MSFPSGNPPAIGIIPLGTGNDLSRSLNWGGKYRDKPLRKVLIDIAKADVVSMDRWTLQMQTHADSSSNLQDFSNCEDQLVLLYYIINQVLQHQGRLKVVKSGTVVHFIYNLGYLRIPIKIVCLLTVFMNGGFTD